MSGICPVCGRSDGEVFMAGDGETGSRAVSHIACVERLWQLPHVCQRAEQAEAELAALKGRRCENCDHRIPPTNCYAAVSCFDGDDGEQTGTPDDFACNRWAEREKP